MTLGSSDEEVDEGEEEIEEEEKRLMLRRSLDRQR